MKVTKIILFAAATLSLVACSNDETTDNGPVAARFTAGIGAPVTRTVGSNWNADHIGIMVTSAPNSDMEDLYKNVEYSTASTGTTADFLPASGGIFFQDKNEEVTFSAYAPYQTSAANALPGTDGVITVNTQNNNGDSQEEIDFLFASGATASQQSPTVTFAKAGGGADNSFHHQMAQLNIVFQVSTADGFEASEILKDGNIFNLGGLVHEGTFDVTSGTTTTTGTAVDSWDITGCKKADDETANTRTYSLILLPQDLSNSPLNVGITIDKQVYTNKADIKPNLEAGKSYTYTITVKKTGLVVSGCTIQNWTPMGNESGDATMQ